MKIEILDSIKGTATENEDAVGYYENYFWIIDGATDLYKSKETFGYSVSEIVNLISQQLPFFCKNSESMKNILLNTIYKVSDLTGFKTTDVPMMFLNMNFLIFQLFYVE